MYEPTTVSHNLFKEGTTIAGQLPSLHTCELHYIFAAVTNFIALLSGTSEATAAIRNGRESDSLYPARGRGRLNPHTLPTMASPPPSLCRIRTNMAILMQTDSHSVSNSKGRGDDGNSGNDTTERRDVDREGKGGTFYSGGDSRRILRSMREIG